MKSPPKLHTTTRARQDIRKLLRFVALQPRGRPAERELDIYTGIADICRAPEHDDIGARRRLLGLELRRRNVAQFAIIYAYIRPSSEFPHGVVSVRAVRHARVKNVFAGVKEPPPPPYGTQCS